MAKYRIRFSIRKGGQVRLYPQRLVAHLFWVTLKEHTTYDSFDIVCFSEEARDLIRKHKGAIAAITEVDFLYKEAY